MEGADESRHIMHAFPSVLMLMFANPRSNIRPVSSGNTEQ